MMNDACANGGIICFPGVELKDGEELTPESLCEFTYGKGSDDE